MKSAVSPGTGRPLVLHCTMIVYLVAGLLTAAFGAAQPGAEWLTQGAYGAAVLMTLYGLTKGARVLARDVGRRALIRRAQPALYDMADYLGGHPDLPKPGRVLALVTADRLLLDAAGRRIEVPLAATRQALRLQAGGRAVPWLVAHKVYGPRPDDAVDVEFRDGRGAPQRLTLARFRRTTAEQWKAALATAIRGVPVEAARGSGVPVAEARRGAPAG